MVLPLLLPPLLLPLPLPLMRPLCWWWCASCPAGLTIGENEARAQLTTTAVLAVPAL
jgi:hypothetical protein